MGADIQDVFESVAKKLEESPPFAVGAQVRTDFYPRNAGVVRTVTAVRPAFFASESGWTVSTGGLSADANWFECVDCGARGRCVCEKSETISGGMPPPA